MIEGFAEKAPISLQQTIEEELIRLMATAITEVFDNERTVKSDDNLSEQ
jgi:hypothetical protein